VCLTADFIFINSSVRGPLLPWYAQDQQHWTWLFTSKLTKRVKLVGPAISCEHFCVPMRSKAGPDGTYGRQCRRNAHVQSVAIATDQVSRSLRRVAHDLLCLCLVRVRNFCCAL
jgi:hypothetical protein